VVQEYEGYTRGGGGGIPTLLLKTQMHLCVNAYAMMQSLCTCMVQ
jgi:hypothetical protein